MTTGVEIDFVVTDSAEALKLYERIFEVERIEVTELQKGQNEAVFTIYGTRFHMLDENADFGMAAPKPDAQPTVWFNMLVPDIRKTHDKALEAGCTEVSPVTGIEALGASNSMFMDKFGYLWMLHQIHREVSYEERMRAMGHEIG